ncbi:MAG: Crp/Fnr family transcriptional regulator [Alphaproteobacteria bacterium]|nr:Crp/Fnr family transcriptional regulator [Alphaproteobacteria bacterium]
MGQPASAEGGWSTPLARKLAWFAELTPDDLKIVDDLHATTRAVRRNRDIVSEGRQYEMMFVLSEGSAVRYRILRDGRRQVLNILLPGDFVGFPGCFFENALYAVTALTNAVVSPVPFSVLLGLFERHPRLAATIFWSFACEAAIYAEHLVDVGRRSALERVAHFLLELLNRLRIVGLADEKSYRMPLTQELIADALGLSVPHVSRTLRQLREDRLVTIEEQRVVINDIEGLSALADFEQGYLGRFRIPASPEGAG